MLFRVPLVLIVASSILGNQAHVLAAAGAAKRHTAANTDWPVYGGQSADDHYSPLRQIDRTNVHKLKVAWTFDTNEPGGLQTNPLIVGRVLFGFTPTQKVIALDAATGKISGPSAPAPPASNPHEGSAIGPTEPKASSSLASSATSTQSIRQPENSSPPSETEARSTCVKISTKKTSLNPSQPSPLPALSTKI
ncbi:hypothetical protein [Tunturiibacter gelidiferens]|uniref:hypothetical protein n=1 Tax=Tunturiibacter gelidiferens TaxID=3069689 RepID=UPI003D9B04DC